MIKELVYSFKNFVLDLRHIFCAYLIGHKYMDTGDLDKKMECRICKGYVVSETFLQDRRESTVRLAEDLKKRRLV